MECSAVAGIDMVNCGSVLVFYVFCGTVLFFTAPSRPFHIYEFNFFPPFALLDDTSILKLVYGTGAVAISKTKTF